MTRKELHTLAVADLAGKIKLATFPLVEAQPGNLPLMAEALRKAAVDYERKAAKTKTAGCCGHCGACGCSKAATPEGAAGNPGEFSAGRLALEGAAK